MFLQNVQPVGSKRLDNTTAGRAARAAIPGERNGYTAISGDRAVGRALARHLCRAKARPTKHLSVHR